MSPKGEEMMGRSVSQVRLKIFFRADSEDHRDSYKILLDLNKKLVTGSLYRFISWITTLCSIFQQIKSTN